MKTIRLCERLPQPVRKKRVAAYARVSTDSEGLLHSLSAQISHYSNLIQANPEWDYAGVYADEAITGTATARRKEFRRMLADCDAGKIDLILTKSISRFARDTVDCLRTVRHLREIGVEVRFSRENLSSLNAEGELLLTLLASFAQAESESIGANVRWAIRNGFREGIPNGHKAAYGYRWDGEMFRIIPEEGKVVRRIFDDYLSGDLAHAITLRLQAEGITGKAGNPISESTVKGILANPSYTGTMILQKYFITTEGHHRKTNNGELPRYAVEEMCEPLISADEFEKAREIRQKRSEALPKSSGRSMFSGLLKCGNCGHSLSRRKSGSYVKWVCNTKERKTSHVCDMRILQESELLAAAEAALGIPPNEKLLKNRVGQIIVKYDILEFQMEDGGCKSIPRLYGGHKFRNEFSGKIRCGICGGKCYRDSRRSRRSGERSFIWICRQPRRLCNLKPLPEETLRLSAGKVLGKDGFGGSFIAAVDRVNAYNDHIDIITKDGTIKTWQKE